VSARAGVDRLFGDICSLEINTVAPTGITGRKMPSAAQALVEVAASYRDSLGMAPLARSVPLAQEFEAIGEEARAQSEAAPAARGRGGAAPGPAVPETDVPVRAVAFVRRVAGNCERLAELTRRPPVAKALEGWSPAFASAPELPLSASELAELRKVWELRTATVSMQTVVQLDGDVITRIDAEPGSQVDQDLLALHRSMVGTSAEHWQFLIEAVGKVVRTFAGFFTGSATAR